MNLKYQLLRELYWLEFNHSVIRQPVIRQSFGLFCNLADNRVQTVSIKLKYFCKDAKTIKGYFIGCIFSVLNSKKQTKNELVTANYIQTEFSSLDCCFSNFRMLFLSHYLKNKNNITLLPQAKPHIWIFGRKC